MCCVRFCRSAFVCALYNTIRYADGRLSLPATRKGRRESAVLKSILSFLASCLPQMQTLEWRARGWLVLGGSLLVILYLYAHSLKVLDMLTAHGVCLLRGRGGAIGRLQRVFRFWRS